MGRIVKAPVVRRAELLDAAQQLFFTAGYEATTINDIIARAGVSKGGFYHHFDSKEALFEALLARIITFVIAETESIMSAEQGDALARLNTFFARARHWNMEGAANLRPAFDGVLKPNSDPLFQRIVASLMSVMTPSLTALIEIGVKEGVFSTPDPALTAETLLHISMTRRKLIQESMRDFDLGQFDSAAARIEKRIESEEALFNRLLGLPAGSVRLGEPGFVRAVLERMHAAEATQRTSTS